MVYEVYLTCYVSKSELTCVMGRGDFMPRNIRKIEPLLPKVPAKKRVAAYARVSSGKDSMLHSISAQIGYYSEFIQKHRGWEYLGVYADEAMTGTTDNRAEFQRILTDCRNGKIDMIITKSISRFARNTVTMLETVRELKNLNVDVFFEKENIHSMSGDGELMLTILASFAQEESRSVSENCKWRIRKGFQDGRPSCASILGYKMEKDTLVIVPHEAVVVKEIYTDFLSGMSKNAIAQKLNSKGLTGKRGGLWEANDVTNILTNEKYAGDVLLQKAFNSDHIEKRKCINKGQLPKYYVQDGHAPIISREIYNQVQNEIQNIKSQFKTTKKPSEKQIFTGKIICEQCGRNYRIKVSNSSTKYAKRVWICPTFNTRGKKYCPSQQIPEDILIDLTTEVLKLKEFDQTIFDKNIKKIIIPGSNKVTFIFNDGLAINKTWENKSRSDSWKNKGLIKEEELYCLERSVTPCVQQGQSQ